MSDIFPITIKNEPELISIYEWYFDQVYEGLGKEVYIYNVNSQFPTGLKYCFSIIDEYGALAYLVFSKSEIFPETWPAKEIEAYFLAIELANKYFYERFKIKLRKIIIPEFDQSRSGEELTLYHKIRSLGILFDSYPPSEFYSIPVVKHHNSFLQDNYSDFVSSPQSPKSRFVPQIKRNVLLSELDGLMKSYNDYTVFEDELNKGYPPATFVMENDDRLFDLPSINTYIVELPKDGRL